MESAGPGAGIQISRPPAGFQSETGDHRLHGEGQVDKRLQGQRNQRGLAVVAGDAVDPDESAGVASVNQLSLSPVPDRHRDWDHGPLSPRSPVADFLVDMQAMQAIRAMDSHRPKVRDRDLLFRAPRIPRRTARNDDKAPGRGRCIPYDEDDRFPAQRSLPFRAPMAFTASSRFGISTSILPSPFLPKKKPAMSYSPTRHPEQYHRHPRA
jgi:hypothetical protein